MTHIVATIRSALRTSAGKRPTIIKPPVGSGPRIVAAMLAAAGLSLTGCSSGSSNTAVTPSITTLADAAEKAYAYTYPLVSVEVTRRQSTNVAAPDPALGAVPMNQLGSLHLVPDAKFTAVVRPNVDTLYTSMFFDVAKEPLVVNVPDMGGRYHVFSIMDMWTDVDASAGPRTLGNVHGYQFALVGPRWHGAVPPGVHEYRLPTDAGWMLGRIQLNGRDDVPNVVAIQNRLSVVPLSAYRTRYTPPLNTDLHPDWPSHQIVADYIRHLTPQQYWDLYYASLSHDQPRPGDQPLLAQLAKFGWTPDHGLDLARLSATDRNVWKSAWSTAISKIEVDLSAAPINGWRIERAHIGDYGSDYTTRAVVARNLLGANLPQDAIYPATRIDANGNQLRSDNTYILHFEANQIPPVHGFWSLTLYNQRGFFVDNPISRYAVRGEQLAKNPDGSIDIYIQQKNPGPPKESNWLPTPTSGEFNLMLRTYWPDDAVVDGSWNPSPVSVS